MEHQMSNTSDPTDSPLLNLPLETRDQIMENVTSMKDLLSACIVCKDLQSSSTRVIYRELEFFEYDGGKFWKCFETLAHNMEAAQAVRSLYIRKLECFKECCRGPHGDPRDPITASQAKIFSAAIRNISLRLTELVLHGGPVGITLAELLPDAFPCLQKLELEEITPSFLPLIRNCPDLKTIFILVAPFTPTEEIHLQYLEELIAPPSIIRTIKSGSIWKNVGVFGRSIHENNQQELLNALVTLDSAHRNSLEGLAILDVQFDTDINYLNFIATTFRGVEVLLLNIRLTKDFSYEISMCRIIAVLHAFTRLRRLDVTIYSCKYLDQDIARATGTDFQILSGLTHLSKSLKSCRLPSGTRWARKDQGHWVPVSNITQCTPWCDMKIQEMKEYESIIKDVRESVLDEENAAAKAPSITICPFSVVTTPHI